MDKVFGCWYEAGDSGTWLTWFINQHKDFPKFSASLHFQEKGNEFGDIPSDYSCDGATWQCGIFNDSKILSFSEYLQHIPIVDPTAATSYSKLCYKLLPWHNPIQTNQDEFDTNETPEQVCTRLIEDSNTDCIIIPQVEISYKLFAMRQAFIRPRHLVEGCMQSYAQKIEHEYKTISDRVRKLAPVHIVAIDKLILRNDEDVYKDLINLLGVPPLPNWKEHTNYYYHTIFRPWENVDPSELNNRKVTSKYKYTDHY